METMLLLLIFLVAYIVGTVIATFAFFKLVEPWLKKKFPF